MMTTGILIVGSGCSGLYCALQLPDEKNILIITKSDCKSSNSFLAQGGISIMKNDQDYDSFFEDTMRAGHYKNNIESVNIMIRSSQDVISDLLAYGVEFQKEENGELAYTIEGAHSEKRVLYHEDMTGKEITQKLLEEVGKRSNITVLEYTTLLDVVCDDNSCYGAIVRMSDGTIETIEANDTVFATGGIGGIYNCSTNYRHLTGDALAIALHHGIELKDIHYIQTHPTTLYTKESGERSFLISESVRGEGAKLYNKNMERFVDELLPRDIVVSEIYTQMEKDQSDFVWEDLRPIPESILTSHFPNIVEHCSKRGYDVTNECIPVVPAQHYFMGGIRVNHNGMTSMEQLYAIGETACNGVHGKNRLASNSLLESLVFAKRAAKNITVSAHMHPNKITQKKPELFMKINHNQYQDIDSFEKKNKELVCNAINNSKEANKTI